MKLEVLRPQDLSAQRLARWTQLQASDITLDSPFLSPEWARAVERAQRQVSRTVQVVVASQEGRDVAFLAVRAGALTAMPPGAPMCDYQGLIAEPGVETDPRQLIAALGVQRYDFCHMIEAQTAFAPFARGRALSHVIDLQDGYQAYEAERRALSTSVLKDADKKRRKVERNLGPATFTAFSRSQTDLDKLVAWKRIQLNATGQTDIFDAGWTLRLMQDLFVRRDPDFGAGLFTLHFGDRLAAVHLHLHGKATVHGWLIAHDPEFDRYSPGILLFQDILRWMDGSPYSRLDLGPGAYRFKQELANTGTWVTHGFVGGTAPAALMRRAAYGVRAAAEALPLGRFSELPGKAMRRMDLLRGLR